MGIAGFFLWLQRWYKDCIDEIPQEVVDAAFHGNALPRTHAAAYSYDNFYVDMNGLIHPCCHDTQPLPEPETEEEMFERMFAQLDLLVRVVRPKKCLVLCIDGVAPRSKMNQQRSRRFRAADERLESDAISNECADEIVVKYGLPRPQVRERWDSNVITPSTAFMERVALALEWYIVKKLNEDPDWRHLSVVFSDAHVPGEGEHKIMQYIRGLRSQPGYDFNTSHVIHGMDADLICLGLSTHELQVSILRNQLTETFQPDHNRFCYFDLRIFREKLQKDFEHIPHMEFERVVDDFIFLCFFVGNDFLPHVPLISIKTRGIEMLLDHYVRDFRLHGYLTHLGEVNYHQLHMFLKEFTIKCMGKLTREYQGVLRAKDRAKHHVEERVTKWESELEDTAATLLPDRSNAQAVSDRLLSLLTSIRKERARLVVDQQQLGFSYLDPKYRDSYYEKKFNWCASKGRAAFEGHVQLCCAEYLRGVQWVMRYYTKGCPSWEWYYPFHYAPLLQDMAAFTAAVDVSMRISAPLHPVEQLLAVLPRLSVHALPEELHEAVNDPQSILGKFYPDVVDIDLSEANFSYQAVLRIPFINCKTLQEACRELVELEDDVGCTFLFCHASSPIAVRVEELTTSSGTQIEAGMAPPVFPIPSSVAAVMPIAGRIGRYEAEWQRKGELVCPDPGIAKGTKYGGPVAENDVYQYRYEMNTHADYRPTLTTSGTSEKLRRKGSRQGRPRDDGDTTEQDRHRKRRREEAATNDDDGREGRSRRESRKDRSSSSHRHRTERDREGRSRHSSGDSSRTGRPEERERKRSGDDEPRRHDGTSSSSHAKRDRKRYSKEKNGSTSSSKKRERPHSKKERSRGGKH